MLLHVDIFVKSMDEMLDFYTSKMGMEIVDDQVVSGELVYFVSNGCFLSYRLVLLKISKSGAMIELMQYHDQGKPVGVRLEQQATVTLLVTSLESRMKRLKEKGVMPASSIFEVNMSKAGKSKIVFYQDPEGNLIELLQMITDD